MTDLRFNHASRYQSQEVKHRPLNCPLNLISLFLIYTAISFGQDHGMDPSSTVEDSSRMDFGSAMMQYFVGEGRYQLFQEWPEKGEFEATLDFEKRLMKWKMAKDVIRRFRATGIFPIAIQNYNADREAFSSIILYAMQNNALGWLNKHLSNRCRILFYGPAVKRSGKYFSESGKLFPEKGCDSISAEYGQLDDEDVENLRRIYPSQLFIAEMQKHEYFKIRIFGFKCPVETAKRFKMNIHEFRWDIDFNTDMALQKKDAAQGRPDTGYVFALIINNIRVYSLQSNDSFAFADKNR